MDSATKCNNALISNGSVANGISPPPPPPEGGGGGRKVRPTAFKRARDFLFAGGHKNQIKKMAKKKKTLTTTKEDKDDVAPLFPSSRLLLGSMNCLALLFLYLLRINLSLSMVCMVKKSILVNASSFSLLNDSFEGNDSYPPRLDSISHRQHLYRDSPVGRDSYPGSSSDDPVIREGITNLRRSLLLVSSSNSTNSEDDRNSVLILRNENESWPMYSNGTDPEILFTEKGEFAWNRQFQGTILSSYFYGYLVTQVLGGYLSGRCGTKHVLGTGMIIMVVMTMLTPVAARTSAYLLIALRVVLGAAGGVFFASVQSIWGPWAPPFERSFLVSLTFFGITLGNILALGISAQFCTVELDNGWPFSFYVTGIAGFVFWVAWNFCVYSTPAQHPRISAREKDYIQRCIGNRSNSKKIERPVVPWLKIVTSPAVWAILAAQVANTWFTHTSITLPFYMKEVLKFDIKENGLFLILPYLLDMLTTPFVSQLADYLRVKKIVSTVAIRKIYQSTSCIVSSTLLIILSFIDADRRYGAVVILCLIYPFQNLYRSGYASNLQDIAPKFAGEIFGITNTAGTICGIVSPVIVGAITTNGTKQEWQTVFFISAALFILGGIIFAVFARGEIEPWANPIQPTELLINNDDDGREKKTVKEAFKKADDATLESGGTAVIPASSGEDDDQPEELEDVLVDGRTPSERLPLNGGHRNSNPSVQNGDDGEKTKLNVSMVNVNESENGLSVNRL